MDITNYLKSIKVPAVLQEKINKIVEFHKNLYISEELKNIFLCNKLNENGSYDYTSLWLFFEDSICEAKDIIKTVDFDYMSKSKSKLKYWNLKSNTETFFESYQENSKIELSVEFDIGVSWNLNASGENCKFLYNLFKEYIFKEFVKAEKN